MHVDAAIREAPAAGKGFMAADSSMTARERLGRFLGGGVDRRTGG
jgi:hypothetical protein